MRWGQHMTESAAALDSAQSVLRACNGSFSGHRRFYTVSGTLGTCPVAVQYGMHEGTSQSAGFVAGAAALLLAAYRAAGINATGAMMKSPIMSGAESLAQLKNRCKSGAGLCKHSRLTMCSALHQ